MPISPAMQRYASEIYRLQQDHPYATLTMVAGHVDASLQAVSRMLGRMEKEGLIERQPYKGMVLTDTGESAAMPALRRHRLAEVFLVKVMKFGWEEAHDLTDNFELGLDTMLEERIDELTGHPTRCPHGEPIPDKEGVIPEMNDSSMLSLQPGEVGYISRVRTHDHDKLRYLAQEGLIPGVGFRVMGRGPFNGPLRILVGKQEHVLGPELAAVIWVDTLAAQELDPTQCNRSGCPLPKMAQQHQYSRKAGE